VVDVIVPNGEIGRKFDADLVGGNLVVFDRPMIGHPVIRMDATLGHVTDHEIPNGHVVDVLVVRSEGALCVVARPPTAAVQNRAVLPDEHITGLRRNRAV
jgi:hypothetical protein